MIDHLPSYVRERITLDERGCWLWTGSLSHNGYGTFRLDGRNIRAHRWTFELKNGPIPAGLVIDHLCRVRRCLNPDHLEAVTNAENVRRGNPGQKRSTHCRFGHPFTVQGRKTPKQVCLTCAAARQAEKRKGAPSIGRSGKPYRLTREHVPEVCRALATQTLAQVARSYGVAESTLVRFMIRWKIERVAKNRLHTEAPR